MLVLLIPWVLLVLCVVALGCLLKRWYWASGLLLVVMLIVNWHCQVFAFGCNALSDKKEEGVLRVLTWNVSRADSLFFGKDKELTEAIIGQDADVIFLTEYDPKIYGELDSLLSSLFVYDGGSQKTWTNEAVYSNIPLKTYEKWNDSICLYCYTLYPENDSIGFFPVHLNSNNRVTPSESFYPEDIEDKEGLSKYLKAYEEQSMNRVPYAEFLCKECIEGPSIVLGDFNDVCGSPVLSYFDKAGLKDAWWKGGMGYGATFHNPLPYRIDHIMYSDGLKLKGIKKVSSNGLSDHDALVADFEIE